MRIACMFPRLLTAVMGLSVLAAGSDRLAADEFTTPRRIVVKVDWDGALAALDKVDALNDRLALGGESANTAPVSVETFNRLNRVTDAALPNIAASPVPVLLPFDLARYLRVGDGVPDEPVARHFSGFNQPTAFLPGPAGYQASFVFRPHDTEDFATMEFKGDVAIEITGAAFLYDLGDPVGLEVKPVALDPDYPGLRRIYLQSHMRYVFVRYGVSYAVSILCFEGRSRAKRLSCREADPIALRFLKALQLVGGSPQPVLADGVESRVERPSNPIGDFAYHAAGQLIPGTGHRRHGGRTDDTVYADIRFPLAVGPSQVYSQIFMFTGDCIGASGHRVSRRGGAPFRCPAGGGDATETVTGAAAAASAIFPWRDNFCETRDFSVGQCPGGRGHQGQDIAPAGCVFDGNANRCEGQRLALVAAHSGTILRQPGQEALVILVNTPTDHIRFRYLHMRPKALDEDGLFSGRMVIAGEPVGRISNFSGREDGTSYHLHFDMQVLTRDGWILVNPYATLIVAYERLIGGRGLEVRESPAAGEAGLVASEPSPPRPKLKRTDKTRRHAAKTHAKTRHARAAAKTHRRATALKHVRTSAKAAHRPTSTPVKVRVSRGHSTR